MSNPVKHRAPAYIMWSPVIVAVTIYIALIFGKLYLEDRPEHEESRVIVVGMDGAKYKACQAEVDISLFTPDLAYKLGVWSAACRARIDGTENE